MVVVVVPLRAAVVVPVVVVGRGRRDALGAPAGRLLGCVSRVARRALADAVDEVALEMMTLRMKALFVAAAVRGAVAEDVNGARRRHALASQLAEAGARCGREVLLRLRLRLRLLSVLLSVMLMLLLVVALFLVRVLVEMRVRVGERHTGSHSSARRYAGSPPIRLGGGGHAEVS